ncbi:MAG: ABC transporter ATP-binding protein/permease [Campylobacteraceae bacterium]|jgi:subfamily B ATP-binding cassette protein MsbA|nr:ABC transporter ATP-binding protein/permease [Campylobacteraceae bacterium]
MYKKIKNKISTSYMVQNYKKILPFIKPYWVRAVLAVVITIPVGSMDALIALLLKPYMDIVLVEKSVGATAYIPLLIIVFSLLQSSLNYAATYLNTWVGRKIANDLKIKLFDRLMNYEASFFDKTSSGEVQFRFNSDVDTACNGLIANIKLFITRVISSIALIGVLFYNSWQLALIALSVMICALYPLTTIRRRVKDIMKKTVFSGSQVVTHFNEAYSGNRVITSYNLKEHLQKKFQETLQSVFTLGIKMVQRTGIMSPMMHFIVSIGIALVIWYGSYLITSGAITPGSFVSFIAALLMLYTPIKAIGNNFNSVINSLMAVERVFELMDAKPKIANKTEAVKLEGEIKTIEYQNVSFGYTEEKLTLKNVNLVIDAGQTIALVGNSGGGKTTIANLLPRFYDVTDGSIKINGIDIRDVDLGSLREHVAVVFQDNFLFSGTIRENIVLDRADVSMEELNTVVKSACLEEFIAELKDGLDAQIGERGVLLSGGQKQRIAIARAFLKNAPIVILDEATSALDNKSEAVVQKAIDNLMKNRTVIVIAHRLSTVRNANTIVVVRQGKIVETGTHEELLEKDDGVYASLYKTQLK